MRTEPGPALSAAERRQLSDVAGVMLPRSAEFGMPGADDPLIQADIVRSVGRELARLRQALAALSGMAGGTFASLDLDKREAIINEYFRSGGAAATSLARLVLVAYYRDDRVLLALGHEPRAPFPKGHEVEQGDWSLLDAVRRRAPFWRDDRKTRAGKR